MGDTTPDQQAAEEGRLADHPQSTRTTGAAVNESGEVVGAWASSGELAQRPAARQRTERQQLTAESEDAAAAEESVTTENHSSGTGNALNAEEGVADEESASAP